MGLSSLPGPSEGVFMILIVNTVLSISIFKEIFRSILQIVGVRLNTPETGTDDSIGEPPRPLDLFPSFPEDLRYRIPAMLFRSFGGCSPDLKCIVCLSKFEPDTEINRLKCGHFFHKACLERWLDYWHTTCPLCSCARWQWYFGDSKIN